MILWWSVGHIDNFLICINKKKKKKEQTHLLSTYQAADKIEKYNLTLVDRGNNNWTVFLFVFLNMKTFSLTFHKLYIDF